VIVINPVLEWAAQVRLAGLPIKSTMPAGLDDRLRLFLQPIPAAITAVFLGPPEGHAEAGSYQVRLPQGPTPGWQPWWKPAESQPLWEATTSCAAFSRESMEEGPPP